MTPEDHAENVISLMAQNWDEVRQQSGYCWDGWRVLIVNAIRQAILDEREACAITCHERAKEILERKYTNLDPYHDFDPATFWLCLVAVIGFLLVVAWALMWGWR